MYVEIVFKRVAGLQSSTRSFNETLAHSPIFFKDFADILGTPTFRSTRSCLHPKILFWSKRKQSDCVLKNGFAKQLIKTNYKV